MKSAILSLIVLSIGVPAFAQTDLYKEEFQFSYLPKKNGGQILYNGTAHSFTIDILSDSINTTEYPNYIKIYNHILQTAIVPLPQSNLDLKRLTIAQQKEALEGYMGYELEYFKNDLLLNYQHLKKEWITVNTRLWLLWTFDLPMQQADTAMQQVVAQIYGSTICFNQILDLNVPLFQDDHFEKTKKLVMQCMSGLKTYNKHQY